MESQNLIDINQVAARLHEVRSNLQTARTAVLELEQQERKLSITLEVLSGFQPALSSPLAALASGLGGQNRGQGALSVLAPTAPLDVTPGIDWSTTSSMPGKTIREMILDAFRMLSDELPKSDVLGWCQSIDPKVNLNTVGSQLSKMVSEGILSKTGFSNYALTRDPSKENTGLLP